MSFPRSSDKPRNERDINMVECSSESSDDEEVDVCVAKWNWGGGSKSKPFVWSILKSTSKSWQDEMCYNFDVAMCKWHNHVIPSLKQLKKHAYCK
jgi:hypothetical protein